MTQKTNVSSKKLSLNPLNRQLGLYSLAAATAGVGILAVATPAESEVVVTQKTIQIPLENLGHGDGVEISFENNGVNDLKLTLSSFSIFGAIGDNLKALNASDGQGVLGRKSNFAYAVALPKGARIGAGRNFVSGAGKGTYFSYGASCVFLAGTRGTTFGSHRSSGQWAGNNKTAYLGVRFLIDGETHYGWVRLTVNTKNSRRMSATITEFAYATEADTSVYAGLTEEPTVEVEAPVGVRNPVGPSLGMLAAGAESLPQWRREQALTLK